ncbi:transposase [Pseudoalteromonas fuliginea]|uniref:Transposase IS200-like domain-containing protein n=1 Tax=Pseudoalteromonas fuliginea TaxID=1872678 RepID=A0ABD3YC11_9GAMM|nr:transposase [Pseudoalteromonas fuliginea]KDC52233.1 hypothetical protein DC53_05905 [Pseudoalteromonas fuliginea]KJZ23048.1 hypothetical protein TW82_19200 [Pseudoalteromonas fuliginea]
MPRPQRIEYEHAFYHVMNRGRGRQNTFHDELYFQAFLTTLGEAQARFDCVIHAYCLMTNHYHLLIETPKANLGHVMRHINGVYTQRYNKLKHTDGPLFRGRYKAILVEKDEYLLQLSRYIHRNPIDMTMPLVDDLAHYSWSSYPAYIGKVKPPEWLTRDFTYQILGHRHKFKQYKAYVLRGSSDELTDFYDKGNIASVLGSDGFKRWLKNTQLINSPEPEVLQQLKPNITMNEVVMAVADYYACPLSKITSVLKGPSKGFEGRKVAMYFCQEVLAEKLSNIAEYFNLGHSGSVSFITHQIREKRREDKQFSKQLDAIFDSIMKQAI